MRVISTQRNIQCFV